MKTPKLLLALLALAASAAQAQPPVQGTPISALPTIGSVTSTTIIPVVDTSTSPYTSKKATAAQLTSGLNTSTGAVAGTIMLRDGSGNSAINVLTAASVTGLNSPVNPTDAATKSYVDASGQGLTIKVPAVAATTGTNITLSGGAPSTLDGVSLALNERILVKDQTDQTTNGIYYVATLGSGSNGTWSRTSDANSGSNLVTGSYIFISGGTVNGSAAYTMVTPGPITIGTSDIVWNLFSQTTQILASNIIGQLIGSQIANATLTYTNFASSISPVSIVSTLPSPSGYTGPLVVINTTDGQLYRYSGGAWTVAVPAVNVTGTITGTQIANGTITTSNLAANSVTASQIAANAVTAGAIAANSITSGQIQAGAITTTQLAAGAVTSTAIAAGTILASNIASQTITAAQIQAGSITADRLTVSNLSSISANIGTITNGTITSSVQLSVGTSINGVTISPSTGLQIASGLLDFSGSGTGNPSFIVHGQSTYANSKLVMASPPSGLPPYLQYLASDSGQAVLISEGGLVIGDGKSIFGGSGFLNINGDDSTSGIPLIAAQESSAGALLGYIKVKVNGVGEVAIPYYHL